ncbi:hypothetical protein B0H21DRAFT_160684 [Amylocystis lapponica]|nr:hypothetical protein B0H21DRAFT_160684 [Amylocystis lapponica]
MEVALDERVPSGMQAVATDVLFPASTSDPFALDHTLNWFPDPFTSPGAFIGRFAVDTTFVPDTAFPSFQFEIPPPPIPPPLPSSSPSVKRKPRRKPVKRPENTTPPYRIHFVLPPPSSPVHPPLLPATLDVGLDGEAETRAANWPPDIPRSMLRAFRADPHRAFGIVAPRMPFHASGPLEGFESVLGVNDGLLREITPEEAEKKEGEGRSKAGAEAARTRIETAHILSSLTTEPEKNAASAAGPSQQQPASPHGDSGGINAHIRDPSVQEQDQSIPEPSVMPESSGPLLGLRSVQSTEIALQPRPSQVTASQTRPLRRSTRKRKSDENAKPKQNKSKGAGENGCTKRQPRKRGARVRKDGSQRVDSDVPIPHPLSPSRTQLTQGFSEQEVQATIAIPQYPGAGANPATSASYLPPDGYMHDPHARLHTASWEQTATGDMHSRTSTVSSADSESMTVPPPFHLSLHNEQSDRGGRDVDTSGYIQQGPAPYGAVHALYPVQQHSSYQFSQYDPPVSRPSSAFGPISPSYAPPHWYPMHLQSSLHHNPVDVHISAPPSPHVHMHDPAYYNGDPEYQPVPQIYHAPVRTVRTVPLPAPIPIPASSGHAPPPHPSFAQWHMQHPSMHMAPPPYMPVPYPPPPMVPTPAWSALFDTLKQGRPRGAPSARRGLGAGIVHSGSAPAAQAPDAPPPLPIERDEHAEWHRCPMCPRAFRLPNGLAIHLKWHWGASTLDWKRGA